MLIATILGAALSSAFSVAYQLPNLIAALVLEATFTAIFVPVLARAERDDPDGGTAFVRRLVTLATTLLLLTTVLAVASAPLLVELMLGDDPLVNRELTTAFAYLLLPQVCSTGCRRYSWRSSTPATYSGRPPGRRCATTSSRSPHSVCISLSPVNFRWIRCRWATRSCSSSASA